MFIEGVRYRRFVIRLTLADGRRRRWVRWAPLEMYMREALTRELIARDLRPEDIKPRSCTITEVPS